MDLVEIYSSPIWLVNSNSPEPKTGAVSLRPLFYSHLGLLYFLVLIN